MTSKNGVQTDSHRTRGDPIGDLTGVSHKLEGRNRPGHVDPLESKKEYIDAKANLRALYRKWHPHPLLVHFPIGSLFLAGLLQLLFLISKRSPFENAAFYSILFATIFEFPAVASGIFSWWLNYRRALTPVFKKKLIYSIALLIMTCCIVITRLLITDISFRSDILSYVYNILVFSSVLVVFAVAYYGGKITWH